MAITGLTIVTHAARELNLFDAGTDLPPDESTYILEKLNRLLDLWNATEAAVMGALFRTFTITPLLQPHTIGPTAGTWTTAGPRPQNVDSAALLIGTGTSEVRTPINVRDSEWWQGVAVQQIRTAYPTDLYYVPDFPLGAVYLWPVPTSAYRVELETRETLAALALTDTFEMAPGYQEALTLTLAESIATPYGVPIPPKLEKLATAARAVVFGVNVSAPRLTTVDAGMPGSRGRGGFNYLTGGFR